MTKVSVLKEIQDCIKYFMKEGLSHYQLDPHITNMEIVPYGGDPGQLKFYNLKDYDQCLKRIKENKQFIFILFDYSIITFSYTFADNNTVESFRCMYLPSVEIISPELFAELKEEELELLNNTEGNVFSVPLRFDYKNPEVPSSKAPETDPYCHVHIGFLEESRLPIKGPINPKVILLFILENFYPKRFSTVNDKSFLVENGKDSFLTQIREEDKKKYFLSVL